MSLHRTCQCLDNLNAEWWEVHLGDVFECDNCGRFWLMVGEDLYSLRWRLISRRAARRLLKRQGVEP